MKHNWNLSVEAAVRLQEKLAERVVRQTTFEKVHTVAGVDADYRQGVARAAVATLNYPDLHLVEYAVAVRPSEFPYVPGLLTFREGPVIIEALSKLNATPDLLIFDGQGIAHPRRLGIASHIGLLVGIPSIGCAKTRLCGHYNEPPTKRGSFSFLTHYGERVGAVVRTRTGVKPVFVSIGHRIDLQASIQYVLNCCRGFRLPETTRWADRLAKRPTQWR